ncbi:MAG TPA: hypothetical protein VF155_10760 [Candidatus Dormibacteraeota bacterium]
MGSIPTLGSTAGNGRFRIRFQGLTEIYGQRHFRHVLRRAFVETPAGHLPPQVPHDYRAHRTRGQLGPSHRATTATGDETHRPASLGQPTTEDAITAWLTARAFSPSTAKEARQHFERGRARGWREQRGITTTDQFTDQAARDCLLYLRDRGAAPATLFSSLASFCAETPGCEVGLRGDAMSTLRLPVLVERIPEALTGCDSSPHAANLFARD